MKLEHGNQRDAFQLVGKCFGMHRSKGQHISHSFSFYKSSVIDMGLTTVAKKKSTHGRG
jgi:hypothetical protein